MSKRILEKYSHAADPSLEPAEFGLSPEDTAKVIAFAAQVMYVTQTGKGLGGVELTAFEELYKKPYLSSHKQETPRTRKYPGKNLHALLDAAGRIKRYKDVPVETRKLIDDEDPNEETFTQYFISTANKTHIAEKARQHFELRGEPLSWEGPAADQA